MSDDKISKFTRSIFIEKAAALNNVKQFGLKFIMGNGCIKCRKDVRFVLMLIEFSKRFVISNFFSNNFLEFLSIHI